jgi:hypothetical protein
LTVGGSVEEVSVATWSISLSRNCLLTVNTGRLLVSLHGEVLPEPAHGRGGGWFAWREADCDWC